MEPEKLYIFNGKKFIDHIKPENFVKRLNTELNINENSDEGFAVLYENLINNHRNLKKDFDKIFFEELFYGRLTHTYIHKIATKTLHPKELFLKRVEKIIDGFKANVTNELHSFMTTRGFYIMDLLHVTRTDASFMAGFDYTEKEGLIETVRFLIGRNVMRKRVQKNKPNETVPEYLLAGVEIDFNKQSILVLHKHTTNVQDEADNEKMNTPSILYNFIMEKVINPLGIDIEFSQEKDQEGMSTFCKFLFNKLIDDVRTDLYEKSRAEINRFSTNAIILLNDCKNPVTESQQKELEAKVSALLLGIYIMNSINEKEMSLKAKSMGLQGYPTRISYKNSRANKSSTGNTRADKSIANADTLYSLLTDFESTKYLESWSMSWFTEPNKGSNIDTIQTTIEAKKNYFKVIFGAKRHLNKEIIHNVIDNLNSYRVY
ncbi:hypothetical protein BS614_26130 [Paenibacillus xylanexedens]|uniref:hypothetical protein n=1 Tax=Paenibacillus xylanexedens TaxID=528191 RepID=UPI0009385BBD|nr:hypothetical protein [Paenibacillus xylanexedens]APO47186.1 hypothetical protein BS614_26130 [Paenibacillus xylanexedens]